MKVILLSEFATKHPSNYSPRLARGFAFVFTKAVLVRKRRRTFGANKSKAPSGMEPDEVAVRESALQ